MHSQSEDTQHSSQKQKNIPKIHIEPEKFKITKSILNKKNSNGETDIANFKINYRVIVSKTI